MIPTCVPLERGDLETPLPCQSGSVVRCTHSFAHDRPRRISRAAVTSTSIKAVQDVLAAAGVQQVAMRPTNLQEQAGLVANGGRSTTPRPTGSRSASRQGPCSTSCEASPCRPGRRMGAEARSPRRGRRTTFRIKRSHRPTRKDGAGTDARHRVLGANPVGRSDGQEVVGAGLVAGQHLSRCRSQGVGCQELGDGLDRLRRI